MNNTLKTILELVGVFILILILGYYVNQYTERKTTMVHGSISCIVDSNNIRVRQWRHFYAANLDNMLDTNFRNFYYPTVVNMFMDSGFTPEKAAIYAEIPTVESGWKTLAKNPNSSATGMWQFIHSTGRTYGLDGSELQDPLLSTNAAIMHIRDLDSLYKGDYAKVLFAYALGVGGLNEQLQLNKTRDPWLADMSTEAYNFVPKVLGAHLYFTTRK